MKCIVLCQACLLPWVQTWLYIFAFVVLKKIYTYYLDLGQVIVDKVVWWLNLLVLLANIISCPMSHCSMTHLNRQYTYVLTFYGINTSIRFTYQRMYYTYRQIVYIIKLNNHWPQQSVNVDESCKNEQTISVKLDQFKFDQNPKRTD